MGIARLAGILIFFFLVAFMLHWYALCFCIVRVRHQWVDCARIAKLLLRVSSALATPLGSGFLSDGVSGSTRLLGGWLGWLKLVRRISSDFRAQEQMRS
jgi:hypothetical protein